MYRYKYRGSVYIFNKCVSSYWEATTYATSKQKALSNLKFRFKKILGKVAQVKVYLPGEITIE